MKNTKAILMSVLMIGIVATAVGATLADFSDIEISKDNFFSTGELNLRVSNYAGTEYDGDDVPALIQYSNAWPCCTKDYYIDLHNAGEGDQFTPWAYVHFMNYVCTDVDSKLGDPKPEPEVAAESGGIIGIKADGTLVNCAPTGECMGVDWGTLNCELAEHVDLQIFWSAMQVQTAAEVTDWAILDLIAMGYDKNNDGKVKLDEIKCEQIELGQIPNCNKLWLDFKFHLQDVDEDDVGRHFFDENIPAEAKWDHWPTNALMKDKLQFDMAFELLQTKP